MWLVEERCICSLSISTFFNMLDDKTDGGKNPVDLPQTISRDLKWAFMDC